MYRAASSSTSTKTLVNSNPAVNKTLLRHTHRDSAALNCTVIKTVPLKNKPTKTPPSVQNVTAPHPAGWTPEHHWGYCGQSCPCCRAEVDRWNGECQYCDKVVEAYSFTVRRGTEVVLLQQANDEDGWPMHLVKYPRGDLVHTGWIYEKNLKCIKNNIFLPGGVPNGTKVVVLERANDENGIAMYHIETDEATKRRGWVYAKNVVDTDDTCPICMETIGPAELFTCTCSHQFHRECIRRWLDANTLNPVCPVCRAPNSCVGL